MALVSYKLFILVLSPSLPSRITHQKRAFMILENNKWQKRDDFHKNGLTQCDQKTLFFQKALKKKILQIEIFYTKLF